MSEVTEFPSPDEVLSILGAAPEPEELQILDTDEEKKIAGRILPFVTAKVSAAFEVKRAKALEKEISDLRSSNQAMIEGELEKMREANKPIDLATMEKLLNQEYVEVTFKVRERGKQGERLFVIRELPQAAESKFIGILQKKLLPRLKQFTSIEWTNTGTVAEKLQRMIEMVPDAMDMLSENCVVILNPWGEEADIDQAWVQNNLSSFRIMACIEAQVAVGKFRDFFSAVYRNIPQTSTT